MQTKPKIHFISGLGADERVFQYLDLPGYENVFVKWVTPIKREPLPDYVKRLLTQIDSSSDVILVGVSFGGIVAQEIAKQIPCKKVIILSSIKNAGELNWQLKLVRYTKINRLVPAWFLKWSNHLTGNYYFGVQTKEESALLHRIIDDTDAQFMKWAIEEIMQWENAGSQTAMHIHGTHDRIFPVTNIKDYMPIPGGGHFMVVNRSAEISKILMNSLGE